MRITERTKQKRLRTIKSMHNEEKCFSSKMIKRRERARIDIEFHLIELFIIQSDFHTHTHRQKKERTGLSLLVNSFASFN